MGKTAALADKAIELLRATMAAVTKGLRDPEATPRERVESMKVGIAAVGQILDRTEPKLSATHEIKTDMTAIVKQLASSLSPDEARKALQSVEDRLLPERISNAGRPLEDGDEED